MIDDPLRIFVPGFSADDADIKARTLIDTWRDEWHLEPEPELDGGNSKVYESLVSYVAAALQRVAATPPDTPSDAAMRAAEEIVNVACPYRGSGTCPEVSTVAAIITRYLAAKSETAVGGEMREIAERIAAPAIGKVKPAVYHEIVSEIEAAISNAYEDAAIIAENCTQDDAARDEPFRIAQTIRDREVREVLEGLRGNGGCWCPDGNPLGMLDHAVVCLATRTLYDKLQPALPTENPGSSVPE